jgi:hypothetical protein
MKTIMVNIDENDIVNQGEYADWFINRLGWRRLSPCANDGSCVVGSESDGNGLFDLPTLSVEWDDGHETDVEQLMIDLGETCGCEEDFDVRAFVWGKTEDGDAVLWGL